MLTFTLHPSASCPECGVQLAYGTKEEPSGWKVFYECDDRCGWEQMTGWVSLADVDHQDAGDKQACEIGKRWAGP